MALRFAGDLRDRVPQGLPPRSAAFGPGRFARAPDPRALDRARPRFDDRDAHRRHAHARARRRRRTVGVPGSRHDRGREVRRPRLPTPPMSYTLTGRIQSRVVAMLPALLLALALHRWWAIELVALMLAVGLLLDAGIYDRALSYQPAWLAVPLGVLELAIIYPAMRYLGIAAPLRLALLLYAVGWLSAQVFAHGLLPRLRLEYARSGRRAGPGGRAHGSGGRSRGRRRPRRGLRSSTTDRSPARHGARPARDPPCGDACRRRRGGRNPNPRRSRHVAERDGRRRPVRRRHRACTTRHARPRSRSAFHPRRGSCVGRRRDDRPLLRHGAHADRSPRAS